ncbi:MAG TPA: uracil phosphoribosyltransferase [Acidimicrobiales bacterium]
MSAQHARGAQARIVDHPVVAHRLGILRERGTDAETFRRLVADIATFVAYEALRDLRTVEVRVDTPVADAAPVRRVQEAVLVVPILRAGLGMVPAVQRLLPHTEVAHVGLRRDEVTFEPVVYLDRLPADLGGRRVVVCDPMLATGGSMAAVCAMVAARGGGETIALCVLASRPGLSRLAGEHPDVRVSCAAVDPELDHRGFIVPGLGDAGDRLFGPGS